jgi:PKD repeat protein
MMGKLISVAKFTRLRVICSWYLWFSFFEMLRYIFLGFFLLIGYQSTMGQCVDPTFTVKASSCLNETLEFMNTSTEGSDFEWDFCAGDLSLIPSATNILSNTSFFRARSLRIVEENGLWYGFTISATANILMRLDFGSTLDAQPLFTNLGNVGSALSSAFAFDIYNEDNTWHILVANGGNRNIIRYSFVNGVAQLPQTTILNTPDVFTDAGPNALEIQYEAENVIALVTVGTTLATTKVVRLNFGASITNTGPTLSEFTLSLANQLRGISLVKECDTWIGFVASLSTNSVYRMNFGSSLLNTPTSSVIATINQPVNVELRTEGAVSYVLVQNARIEAENAGLFRLNFGDSYAAPAPTSERLAFSELTGGGYALDVVSMDSKWYAFTFNLTSQNLVRISFPDNCSAVQPINQSSKQSIFNSYSEPGNYSIVLKYKDNTGRITYTKHNTTVSTMVAPIVNFTAQNICEDAPVNFASTASLPIINYDWNFGDGNASNDASPSNTFLNDGEYKVRLVVTADNACQNLMAQTVSIFNQPIAGFDFLSLPQYCTNQQYDIQNTSTVDPGYPVTWQWQVNGAEVSTDEDLLFAFTSTASQEIKLIASIPGCSSETSQTINSLSEGPIPDFMFTGQCQETPVSFTNTTTGSVSGYNWDFGDGQNSIDEDPLNSYGSPGTFDVTLTAFGTSGCNNTKTESVTIYSKPQTDFSVALPPFSCSGAPTQFTDNTPNPFDSNLASWQWNFGDGTGSSTARNPQYTFQNAGDYSVSLTATTNFGCSTTIQKPVTISPSPVANFTNSPPCLGVPVNFTNTSTGLLQSQQWQIQSSFYTVANPVHAFLTSGDKNVTLNVTATNGCISSVSRTLNVPAVLTPDFSVSRNCINQQTEFTDITNDAADAVVGYAWNFAGLGNGTENPQVFSFANTGNFNVSLSVTTQTGCVHSAAKNVSIINSPQASFIATPSFGPPPLQVQFTNTSTNATSYLWEFKDPNTSSSTSVSPSFTFSELGSYEVDLTAFNAQGCSTLFSRLIEVVIPFTDVALTQLELIKTGQASIKPAVTIQNKSNIAITNLPLAFEVDGTAFRTFVATTIPPNSSYYHLSDFELPPPSSLSYVCALAEIEDTSPNDNQLCASVDQPIVVLAPYPNPATAQSHIEVQWIVRENRAVEVFLINSIGQMVYSESVNSVSGLNTFRLPATGFQTGLYFLLVRSGDFSRTHRLMVLE